MSSILLFPLFMSSIETTTQIAVVPNCDSSGVASVSYPPHLNLSQRLRVDEDTYEPRSGVDQYVGELSNGDCRAIKVSVKVLRQRPTQDFASRLRTQVETWYRLDNPRIASVYGIAHKGSFAAIVVSYYPNGNAIEYLKSIDKLPEGFLLSLIKDLVTAVVYLHEQGVVHGDIRGKLVMVDEARHAVLTDVGIENAVYGESCSSQSYRWKPREAFIEDRSNLTFFPFKADIYSLGRTIEQLCTLEQPFSHIRGEYRFLHWLCQGKLAGYVSPSLSIPTDILGIIKVCCADDLQDRPTALAVLNGLETRAV